MAEYSVGVEEEYQLVDPETGALRSRARDVLRADWSEDIQHELHETTLEIGTRICESADAVERELRRLRFQVGTAAAAEGLGVAASGTHPFARWESQRMYPEARYAAILERYGRLARDEHNFGMHVHVEVPGRASRIEVMNRVRHFLPHLLALSASSPFYDGGDTRFASYRTVLWRRWPFSGIPPRFANEAEHEALLGRALEARALTDRYTVYWSVRAHPEYPTLEFRVTDVCPRLDDAVSLAALMRALTAAAVDGALEEPRGFSESVTQELLDANLFQAARWGLDAQLVYPGEEREHEPARAAIRRLVERVHAYAGALGDADRLEGIEVILERGNGADRMRRVHHDDGALEGVVLWLAKETSLGTGLDRRRAQRPT